MIAGKLPLQMTGYGSGSSRLSPRNSYVANILDKDGFATLLFDLLSPVEDSVYANRFAIDLLSERLKSSTLLLRSQPQTADLVLGYFGASTGTASALRAAAELGTVIKRLYPAAAGRTLPVIDVTKRLR